MYLLSRSSQFLPFVLFSQGLFRRTFIFRFQFVIFVLKWRLSPALARSCWHCQTEEIVLNSETNNLSLSHRFQSCWGNKSKTLLRIIGFSLLWHVAFKCVYSGFDRAMSWSCGVIWNRCRLSMNYANRELMDILLYYIRNIK